ncbi:MAG: sigma-70 family RNA polymerase sigma factor [Anaerolineae bacterium]|nr:sigma-70 family RNA polymerase sigma factor [Anaerolineae bacterium]
MVKELQQEGLELIDRIKQQDQLALTELYEMYGRMVYNMAMHVLRSEAAAEEVTQDIFFEIWRKPDRWDPQKGRLSSWLLAVTRYRAIDRLRRDERRPLRQSVALDDLAHLLSSRETVGDAGQDAGRLLRDLLKDLPAEQRQAINLAFFRGLSHHEIAAQLNLPLGTVKGRIRLGLEKLREGWLAAHDDLNGMV